MRLKRVDGAVDAGAVAAVLVRLPDSAARRIVSAEQDPDGGSNIWYRAATLLVSHWLI